MQAPGHVAQLEHPARVAAEITDLGMDLIASGLTPVEAQQP
jgi:hypothetical protein